MSGKSLLALGVMAGSVVMGILGDLLLRQTPWGLNVLLWLAALSATVALLARLRPADDRRLNRWMLLPVVVFAGCFAWRASIPLKLMDALAILVALGLIAPLPRQARIRPASLADYAISAMLAGVSAAIGALLLIFGDVEWKEVSREDWGRPTLAVGRGLALAVPPLLVFGILLMSADAVFAGLVRTTLHINIQRLFVHAFVISFCAWIAAGYLRGLLISKGLPQEVQNFPRPFSLGLVEIGIVLGLVDLLFLAFVAVEVRYLFGGAPLVGITPGLTYAEYARRGFFELVLVAALVLPLLLAAHWLMRQENPAHLRIFRALAGVQILLLFVIMASAAERMRLYTGQFGLTEQRLYAAALMAWLAVVFVWFAATVLRGRRDRFAFGAMLAGFLLIGVLQALNPDALIARVNVERAREGRRFDARYAAGLSADAVPELVAHLSDLSPQDSRVVASGILKRRAHAEQAGWRSWSWSRAQAAKAVESHAALLEQMAAPRP